MRSGTASFLAGAALLALLALALLTVALGVLAALRMPRPDDPRPDDPQAARAPRAEAPPPITRHGRWELRQLPDGTSEYAWIARQARSFGPETTSGPRPDQHHRTPV
ncbi:hypothetical protein ACWEQL_12375 [Kitasatospora sp. NPDC004240]